MRINVRLEVRCAGKLFALELHVLIPEHEEVRQAGPVSRNIPGCAVLQKGPDGFWIVIRCENQVDACMGLQLLETIDCASVFALFTQELVEPDITTLSCATTNKGKIGGCYYMSKELGHNIHGHGGACVMLTLDLV